MFEWSRGSSLRAMMQANVPGAEGDEWLEGWMFGFVQSRLKLNPPLDVLDIAMGEGPRPYRATMEKLGANIRQLDAQTVSDQKSIAESAEQFDLVMLLSLERETCLRPLDLERPLDLLDMLLNATKLLKPGGALVWSYLYCFSSSPDHLHDFLEPAAVYQAIRRRNFRPMSDDYIGVDRVTIFNSSDTLFVRHKPLLAPTERHERVVRTISGLFRPGGNCRVAYLTPEHMLTFAPPK